MENRAAWLPGQRSAADLFQFTGNHCAAVFQGKTLAAKDRCAKLGFRLPDIGKLTGNKPVQHNAQSINVGSCIKGWNIATKLLGGHEGQRARRNYRMTKIGRADRNAKVGKMGLPILIQQDIRWLDVAVDVPLRVGVDPECRLFG